jgi:hypothetical protein
MKSNKNLSCNHSRIFLFFFSGILILSLSMLLGCSSQLADGMAENAVSSTSTILQGRENTIAIDKLEVFHFHATRQCYSCITVGNYAEETINTFFKDELDQGIIIFKHIDNQLPENQDDVVKYGVTGSSLWLGTYKGDEFTPEQNVQVWYKIGDKQSYMDYLRDVIESKLAGRG